MSVPFKYRQQFRDVITSLGGKAITTTDFEYITARLPPPQFSAAVVDKYASKCPLDETSFLSFIAEGQKECGLSYDDITWGLVEGMARANFFGGAPGGDASCDTKELRVVLDPKIRPVRLDVNNIFATVMSNRERITIAELMLVFRAVFPPTQTNFAELFTWARATKSAPRARAVKLSDAAAGNPKANHDSESHSASASAVSSAEVDTQHVLLENSQTAAAVAATEHPRSSASGAEVAHSHPVATLHLGTDVTTASTAPQPRVEAAVEEHASSPLAPPRGVPTRASSHLDDASDANGSPPPPPPPPEDPSPSPSDVRTSHAPDASSPFAAYVLDKERGASPPVALVASPPGRTAVEENPTVVVVAPPPAPSSPPPGSGRPTAAGSFEQQSVDDQNVVRQSTKQAALCSVPLVEPPPLPPHIRATLSTVASQRIPTTVASAQQPAAEGVQTTSNAAPGQFGGGTFVSESLTLRHVQQLPPEVLEFIQQLDAQRGALQVQLQRELDDLTANTSALRVLKERLTSLEALQSSPVFAPLESERQDLIHRMEQWVHATRAGKDAARAELNRLRQQRAADVATQAVYRDSGLLTTAATTSTYNPAGTAAATAAIAALNDPSPRLARFFETLSAKEKEIKLQEEAMEKLRLIEKRERRLLSQLSATPIAVDSRSSRGATTADAPRQAAARHPGTETVATPAPAAGGYRVFRMARDRDTTFDSRVPEATRPETSAVPPAHVFLSPQSGAAVPGFTPTNPYLSHNVASRGRTGVETSGSVTKRLEDYMMLTRRKDA